MVVIELDADGFREFVDVAVESGVSSESEIWDCVISDGDRAGGEHDSECDESGVRAVLGEVVRYDEFLFAADHPERIFCGGDFVVFPVRRDDGVCVGRVLFRDGDIRRECGVEFVGDEGGEAGVGGGLHGCAHVSNRGAGVIGSAVRVLSDRLVRDERAGVVVAGSDRVGVADVVAGGEDVEAPAGGGAGGAEAWGWGLEGMGDWILEI